MEAFFIPQNLFQKIVLVILFSAVNIICFPYMCFFYVIGFFQRH